MSDRLSDRFGRRVHYLRLSVTDRCDLRCSYCMPERTRHFQDRSDWLSFDEIVRVVAAFAALGLQRIRLTGGEPLLRKGLPLLAARLSTIAGITDMSLSTNGTQLARHAAALRTAGVSRLNVSLDTLDRLRFARITRHDALDAVLEGLAVARELGFAPVKLNMVVLSDTSDAEIDAMVAYCIAQGFVLRLIEVMPVGAAARATPMRELSATRERLRTRFNLVDGIVPGAGPARYLVSEDGRCKVGFITPFSQHFCDSCNRVRLGADGMLYLCLGQNDRVDLRPVLRAGCSDAQLQQVLRTAIWNKPERHEFGTRPAQLIRFMSSTGG